MKSSIAAAGLLTLALLAAPAAAQTSAAPAAPPQAASGERVAVINVQEAIISTAEGKRELAALQTRFAPKKAELESLNSQVQALKKAGPAQAKALKAKEAELQSHFQADQGAFQQATVEVVNRIGVKLLKVMGTYAGSHGYTVVLDASNPRTTSVLWAAPTADITKAVVAAYDAETSK